MAALVVNVTTLATVVRDGAGWATRRYDVEGNVVVPDGAKPDVDRGARCFRWHESPHAIDTACPVCMSAAVCMQEVTLYPDTGGIVVVHESDPTQEMN